MKPWAIRWATKGGERVTNQREYNTSSRPSTIAIKDRTNSQKLLGKAKQGKGDTQYIHCGTNCKSNNAKSSIL
jgi:hypothetical protein